MRFYRFILIFALAAVLVLVAVGCADNTQDGGNVQTAAPETLAPSPTATPMPTPDITTFAGVDNTASLIDALLSDVGIFAIDITGSFEHSEEINVSGSKEAFINLNNNTVTVTGNIRISDGTVISVSGPGTLIVNGSISVYGADSRFDKSDDAVINVFYHQITIDESGGGAVNVIDGGTASVTNIKATATSDIRTGGVGVFGAATWNGGTVYVSGDTFVEHHIWAPGAMLNNGGTVFFGGNVTCSITDRPDAELISEIDILSPDSDVWARFLFSEPTNTGVLIDGYIWDEFTAGFSFVYKRQGPAS